jgi:predicted phage tail component-like protein
MALPTFNGFSLQDSNFITERVVFRGYASREVIRANVNRREGIKLLGSNFGEKEITIEGKLIASSASDLQSKLDDLKKALTIEEGDLVIETDRTFLATVSSLAIPDEHYNQSRAPYMITFICSNPFAEGTQLTSNIPVVSGLFTVSGTYTVSGNLFSRPVIVYTPPTNLGNTLIRRLDLYHAQTGQTISISGFNGGAVGGLKYTDTVTFNLDDFVTLEGTSAIDNSGSFPKFEPGINDFTLTASGRKFPGGTVSIVYKPRYL